jgi:hypothetical protein
MRWSTCAEMPKNGSFFVSFALEDGTKNRLPKRRGFD